MSSESLAPTAKQLRALRRLAESRGMTFCWPATRAEASRQIALLVNHERSPARERREDRDAVVLRESPHLPASTVDHSRETVGWAGSARWRRR